MTRICIRVGVYVAQHGADFAAIRRVQDVLQTTTKDAGLFGSCRVPIIFESQILWATGRYVYMNTYDASQL